MRINKYYESCISRGVNDEYHVAEDGALYNGTKTKLLYISAFRKGVFKLPKTVVKVYGFDFEWPEGITRIDAYLDVMTPQAQFNFTENITNPDILNVLVDDTIMPASAYKLNEPVIGETIDVRYLLSEISAYTSRLVDIYIDADENEYARYIDHETGETKWIGYAYEEGDDPCFYYIMPGTKMVIIGKDMKVSSAEEILDKDEELGER